MRIAVPVFQGRVAPVFDWCESLAVVEAGSDGEAAREEVSLRGVSASGRADRLVELRIETLLCGGISAPMTDLVEARGIRVVPWAAGPVEEVIGAFQQGTLTQPRFTMPGCCGRRGRGRHGRGGRQGRGRRGCGPR